jgi:hypothetical protein
MSDSLNGTVIVIEPALMICANGELEPLDEDEPLEELELPPRLPADDEPPASPEEPLDEDEAPEELLDAAPVDPAEIASPVETLASETIVPLIGAYSFVFESADWALCTLASAL